MWFFAVVIAIALGGIAFFCASNRDNDEIVNEAGDVELVNVVIAGKCEYLMSTYNEYFEKITHLFFYGFAKISKAMK